MSVSSVFPHIYIYDELEMSESYIILGAGVIGLTTALELSTRYPSSSITILAKHLPGDQTIDYTSPWAGANWFSAATDNGRQEEWDAVTYKKFEQLADQVKESGIQRMGIRAFYDSKIEDAGILSEGTGKIWFDGLVGGLKFLEKERLAEGSVFGFECDTFVINVQVYLPW
jgi:D-amino-acid oxidase